MPLSHLQPSVFFRHGVTSDSLQHFTDNSFDRNHLECTLVISREWIACLCTSYKPPEYAQVLYDLWLYTSNVLSTLCHLSQFMALLTDKVFCYYAPYATWIVSSGKFALQVSYIVFTISLTMHNDCQGSRTLPTQTMRTRFQICTFY